FPEQVRFQQEFAAELSKSDLNAAIKGMTISIGQQGAFIKTRQWQDFKLNDQVEVSIFLPSVFREPNAVVGMSGSAVVTGIDPDNELINIEFARSFRRFKKVGEVGVPAESRYKKIAHYVTLLDDICLKEFLQKYPNGFFASNVSI
ncbi:MAG: hypothetical protein JRI89_17690, partial [Deltaproteobacteria bacterium]|nr:hypothetical protein [Deltaproteobacteria bacterium]